MPVLPNPEKKPKIPGGGQVVSELPGPGKCDPLLCKDQLVVALGQAGSVVLEELHCPRSKGPLFNF